MTTVNLPSPRPAGPGSEAERSSARRTVARLGGGRDATRRFPRSRGLAAAAVLAVSVLATPSMAAGEDNESSAHSHAEADATGGSQRREVTTVEAEERLLALASQWVIDDTLTTPAPGDSSKTKRARAELASLAQPLRAALRQYDRSYERADQAAAELESAKLWEASAQVEVARAGLDVVSARGALDTLVRGRYTEAGVSELTLLTDPSADQTLTRLSLSSLLDERQATAVKRAAEAERDLAEAERQLGVARVAAEQTSVEARAALRRAKSRRTAALEMVAEARQALRVAVAADMAAQPTGIFIDPRGDVSFPLPPSAYVDNNNFGGSGAYWSRSHTGNDYSVACGTPVLAANDGRVAIRTDQGWAGPWLVMVRAPDGFSTWYAHMQALTVADGDWVKAGQQIGAVGSEGNSTGCHLHFEYHPLNGSIYEDATDPVAWLAHLGITGPTMQRPDTDEADDQRRRSPRR